MSERRRTTEMMRTSGKQDSFVSSGSFSAANYTPSSEPSFYVSADSIMQEVSSRASSSSLNSDERTPLLLGEGRKTTRNLPWYRTPHPVYIHIHTFIMAVAMGLIAAAQIEQFTQTICLQINEDTLLSNPTGQVGQSLLFLTPDQCRHSTTVQKRVAHLNLLISVIMGIACVITTPFWGALSDKVGRKICINLNTLSFVLGDLILVLVLTFPDQISYWWILLNPLIEGLFGGLGGGQTILGAYIGDITAAGSRAGTFSVMMGTFFAGVAIGPAIGSFSIRLTNNPIAPFYVAAIVHTLQTLMGVFILPESLSNEKKEIARQMHQEKKAKAAQALVQRRTIAKQENFGILRRLLIQGKICSQPVVSIFSPLAKLGPIKRENGKSDWSLPILAFTCGIYSMMMSIYSIKLQYAQLKFGWSGIELGNFLSLLGIGRIVALCICIPLVLKMVRKPHQEPVREMVNNGNTMGENTGDVEATAAFYKAHIEQEWESHKVQHKIVHDNRFDLNLCRFSMLIDVAAYIALYFSQTAFQFVSFIMLQCLGSATNPALSSLSLMFADPNEMGSLMAAFSVLQIIFGQVIGPVVFNAIFAATVDDWPQAFFLVGAWFFFLCFICLLCVKVRKPKWGEYNAVPAEMEVSIMHAEGIA